MDIERGAVEGQQREAGEAIHTGRFLFTLITLLVVSASVLGALAAFESKKIAITEVRATGNGGCVYPKEEVFLLGLASSIVLVAAQIIIHIRVACSIHKMCLHPTWNVAINLVFLWFMFVYALFQLAGPQVGLFRKQTVVTYEPMNHKTFSSRCISVTPFDYAVGVVCAICSTTWATLCL